MVFTLGLPQSNWRNIMVLQLKVKKKIKKNVVPFPYFLTLFLHKRLPAR